MDWISVEDRLPNTQEAVLVFCGKSMRVASYNHEGWTLEGSFHEYDEEDGSWGYDQVFLRVLHWMPLPEPPKDEE